jgi:four helix bundle protein
MKSITNSNSILGKKSYSFSLEIIKLYKYLTLEKKDYILSKQILRSGTSIGANVNEALSAESKKDFVHKLGISFKETKETSYWLNLLFDSNYISEELFKRLDELCNELYKILASIIITTKEKYLIKKPNS